MPELPEVETSRRGVIPHIEGRQLVEIIVRQPKLRWPVDVDRCYALVGEQLNQIHRRGKYLLLNFDSGTQLLHLGMSGSLRVLAVGVSPDKHDHIDFVFDNHKVLRFNDPRRFGALVWAGENPNNHPLLKSLGPEPLDESFNAHYCYAKSRGKRLAIKQWLMDGHNVVGVGNIYANESLFRAGIHPSRQAGRISLARYENLVENVKQVIARAIEQGGTTLRDFTQVDGKPGYFKQTLAVYGRGGQPCTNCGDLLRETRHNQRATVFCASCQS